MFDIRIVMVWRGWWCIHNKLNSLYPCCRTNLITGNDMISTCTNKNILLVYCSLCVLSIYFFLVLIAFVRLQFQHRKWHVCWQAVRQHVELCGAKRLWVVLTVRHGRYGKLRQQLWLTYTGNGTFPQLLGIPSLYFIFVEAGNVALREHVSENYNVILFTVLNLLVTIWIEMCACVPCAGSCRNCWMRMLSCWRNNRIFRRSTMRYFTNVYAFLFSH